MKNYQLTYLISPDLSEEELKNLSEKIKNFIQEETGTLEKITEPSKRELGYPIKKKGEAFLATLNFSFQPTADQPKAGNPEKLGNLENKLKSEKQILRYLILTKKTIRERPERIIRKEVLPGIKKPLEVTKKVTPPKKVELKEIDKKIEEILGE